MFRGVSDTCQNMFRMIYFEAEDIFWKWFLDLKRDQSVTTPTPPHPWVSGGGVPWPSYGYEPNTP